MLFARPLSSLSLHPPLLPLVLTPFNSVKVSAQTQESTQALLSSSLVHMETKLVLNVNLWISC